MSRRPFVWLVVLVVLAAAGHWAWWYRPRERAGAPDGTTLPGSLYFGSEFAYRAWLPFPHQNLGRLEWAIGDLERFGRAVGTLSGREPVRLPSFGTARVPPAHELALAADASGDRFVVVARVYPVMGFLARLAGRLAGNPLLAGGETVLDGRPVRVEWRDGSWTVATRSEHIPSGTVDARGAGPALLWTRLDASRGRLPAGEYGLRRVGGSLEIAGGDARRLGQLRRLEALEAPVPLLVAEVAAGEPAPARSLALLPGVESLGGLPGAIAVHRGEARWRVPGERVVEWLSDGLPEAGFGEWKAVALEDASLTRGGEIGGFLDGVSPAAPVTGVWIDLAAARRLVRQTATALEAVPIVGRREARRWRAVEDVLAPLTGAERLTVWIATSPAAMVVRLGAPVPAGD